MNVKNIYSLLLIFALLFTGCHPIYKAVYGMKNPTRKSEITIKKFIAKRITKDSTTIYSLAPETYMDNMPYFMRNPLTFLSNGEFVGIGQWNGENYCALQFDDCLKNAIPYNDMAVKPNKFLIGTYTMISADRKDTVNHRDSVYTTINDIDSIIYDFSGNKAHISIDKSADYVLLIPFGVFMGKRYYNKDIKTYYDAAKENTKAKFQIIFLNIDMQDWWDKKWDIKIKI